MFTWPKLELTEYEKTYVQRYTDKTGKPGVLKRVYRVGTFSTVALEAQGQTQPVGLDTVQVSRYSRVFGLTFVGNLGSWYLNITDPAGTKYTAPNNIENRVLAPGQAARPKPGCLVSSMIPGWQANVDSWRGPINPNEQQSQSLPQLQRGPLVIEPNIVLYPNVTLQFEATLADAWQLVLDNPEDWEGTDALTLANLQTLTIGVHVWEFPGMGDREVEEK